MALTAPTLAGITLPLVSKYARRPVAVQDDRVLASGTIARYHRGHRHTFELSWSMLKADAEDTVETLGKIRGVTQYVDIDGTPYVVLVDQLDDIIPIPGTAPEKYAVGLTLLERRPR